MFGQCKNVFLQSFPDQFVPICFVSVSPEIMDCSLTGCGRRVAAGEQRLASGGQQVAAGSLI